MNFLALNDDVKFIIASHLQSDRKINKIFMNEPDDNLQKNLFGEVKEMTLDIEEINIYVCMDGCVCVRVYACVSMCPEIRGMEGPYLSCDPGHGMPQHPNINKSMCVFLCVCVYPISGDPGHGRLQHSRAPARTETAASLQGPSTVTNFQNFQ
jgi:hypothetical protein